MSKSTNNTNANNTNTNTNTDNVDNINKDQQEMKQESPKKEAPKKKGFFTKKRCLIAAGCVVLTAGAVIAGPRILSRVRPSHLKGIADATKAATEVATNVVL